MGSFARGQNERVERPHPGGITWTITGERIALLAWPRAILLRVRAPARRRGRGRAQQLPRLSDRAVGAPARHCQRHAATDLRDRPGSGRRARARFSAFTIGSTARCRVPPADIAPAPAIRHTIRRCCCGSRPRSWTRTSASWSTCCRRFPRKIEIGIAAETASFAVALGARESDIPLTWQHLQDYMRSEIGCGRIVVGAEARALAPAVLRPAFGRLIWPFQYAGELVTVGSLPPGIREGYGFPWDASRERRRRRVLAALRGLRRFTPDVIARWPEARRASR